MMPLSRIFLILIPTLTCQICLWPMVRFPVKSSTPIKQHCNPKSPYSHLFSFIAATAITSPLSLPPSHSIAADTFTTPLFTTDRDADKPHILHQRLYSGDLKQNVTHRKNPHISAYTRSSTPKRLKSRLFTNSLPNCKEDKARCIQACYAIGDRSQYCTVSIAFHSQ